MVTAVASRPFPDWSFHVVSAAPSVVVLVPASAFSQSSRFVFTHHGHGGGGGVDTTVISSSSTF